MPNHPSPICFRDILRTCSAGTSLLQVHQRMPFSGHQKLWPWLTYTSESLILLGQLQRSAALRYEKQLMTRRLNWNQSNRKEGQNPQNKWQNWRRLVRRAACVKLNRFCCTILILWSLMTLYNVVIQWSNPNSLILLLMNCQLLDCYRCLIIYCCIFLNIDLLAIINVKCCNLVYFQIYFYHDAVALYYFWLSCYW